MNDPGVELVEMVRNNWVQGIYTLRVEPLLIDKLDLGSEGQEEESKMKLRFLVRANT